MYNFQRTILREIIQERKRQDEKWGNITSLKRRGHSTHYWLTILMEEVGEAAQEALDNDLEKYRIELIQVAAVIVAMLEHLDYGITHNT